VLGTCCKVGNYTAFFQAAGNVSSEIIMACRNDHG
jgi:hypothetical protein